MKSLYEYLLEEVDKEKSESNSENQKPKKKKKKNSSGPPDKEFEDISNAGSLSKAALEFIGGKLKDQKAAAETDTGKQAIRKGLGAGDGPGTKDPFEILTWLFSKENKLNQVFTDNTEEEKNKYVVLNLKGGWQKLAQREESSKKLLKFWISSSLTAFGVKNAWDLGYAINGNKNQMMIYKK